MSSSKISDLNLIDNENLSIENDFLLMNILHSTSPSPKLINTCKNCLHTFRVRKDDLQNFCTKDCETCYGLFSDHNGLRNMNSSNKNINDNNIETNKQLIFEFQRQIDLQYYNTINDNNIKNKCIENNTKNIKNYFEPKKIKIKTNINDINENQSIWNTATPWRMNAPKPNKPQLHAYF